MQDKSSIHPLHKDMLFLSVLIVSILVALLVSISIAYNEASSYEFCFTSQCYSTLYELYKISFWIVASGFAMCTLIATTHRSRETNEQIKRTDIQIKKTEEKNTFDTFIKHKNYIAEMHHLKFIETTKPITLETTRSQHIPITLDDVELAAPGTTLDTPKEIELETDFNIFYNSIFPNNSFDYVAYFIDKNWVFEKRKTYNDLLLASNSVRKFINTGVTNLEERNELRSLKRQHADALNKALALFSQHTVQFYIKEGSMFSYYYIDKDDARYVVKSSNLYLIEKKFDSFIKHVERHFQET